MSIITRNSSTASSVPSSLDVGELAVNTTDDKLYVGTAGGVVHLNPEAAASNIDNGTTINDSVRWDGSKWVPNSSVTINQFGALSAGSFSGIGTNVTGVDAAKLGTVAAADYLLKTGSAADLSDVDADTFNNLGPSSYARTGSAGSGQTLYGDGSNLTGVKATKTNVGRVSAAGGTVYDPLNTWGVVRTAEGLYTLTFSVSASPSSAQAMVVSVEGALALGIAGGILVQQTSANQWTINTFYVTSGSPTLQDLGFSFVRYY